MSKSAMTVNYASAMTVNYGGSTRLSVVGPATLEGTLGTRSWEWSDYEGRAVYGQTTWINTTQQIVI